jgi:2-polyprenyl-6-methoxyphenol hydroxylase-like FAD-dependent oxidoreductase
MRRTKRPQFKKALVIGGSIAGLLSARILSDYFESVVIVEANTLSDKAEERKGVPQSVQPHILFAKGYRILLELFPNLDKDAFEKGALPIDWAKEFHLYLRGWNLTQDKNSGIESFTCSRILLEFILRKRVLQIPNIDIYIQHKVSGLLQNEEAKKVNGVRVHSLYDKNDYEIYADLIVDASGRSSKLPEWLDDLGYTSPTETIIDPKLGYATRKYKAPKDYQSDWKVMLISQSPPDCNRLGYLSKIENKEWIATVGGYGADYPTNTSDGFLGFAKSLPSDRFYEAIKKAEPITPVITYRATSNRLRHYERITMPEGLICIGDSVCALCPIYGQGISVAALSALVLKKWIETIYSKDLNFESNIFQKELMKSNFPHWNLAVTQDAKFKTTIGREYIKDNWILRLIGKYTDSILKRAQSDSKINLVFIKVSQIVKSPLEFFHPYVIYSVLRNKNKKICNSQEHLRFEK